MHDRYQHLERIRQSLVNCSELIGEQQKKDAVQRIQHAYLFEMGTEERYPVRSNISYK